MDVKREKLRTLPVEYLWDGLVLTDDIYNHDGSVLLIPQGEEITHKKLGKLLNFDSDSKHIMVYEESYYKIMSEGDIPHELRQKVTEGETGYTEIKNDIGQVLHKVTAEEKIQAEEVEPLIHDISQRLNVIDPTVIFECINFPRPMDEYLQRHSLNVAFLNGLMGEWMKLPKEDVRILVMAGLLHDVGKTKIPQEILDAPRKLTDEEFKTIKSHPIYSYELLESDFDERVKLAARHHHEKVDGKGYPDGIEGDQISLFARITAVSDIYDAMVSRRSYKEEKLPFDVLDNFYNNEYDGLDMDLVMVLIKNMREHFLEKDVIMSNGNVGKIKYIPPNDIAHPIIQNGKIIKQTDERWFCKKLISSF